MLLALTVTIGVVWVVCVCDLAKAHSKAFSTHEEPNHQILTRFDHDACVNE